jgi:hypothetical protein
MKYALVDRELRPALRSLQGECLICGAPVMPKCGQFRAAHWAYLSGDGVDHRWEPETAWHRDWKGYFPEEWQEVIHHASNGERHFADVKTAHGLVIEFQNSPISEEERRSREEFYRRMWWVVNGQRLEGDRPRFFAALRRGSIRSLNPLTLSVPADNCLLLRKWADSRVPVFFDFCEIEEPSDMFRFGARVLWASHPRRPNGRALLIPVYRENFVKAAINGTRIKGVDCSKAFERERRVLLVIRRRPHYPTARARWDKPYTPRRRRTRRRWKKDTETPNDCRGCIGVVERDRFFEDVSVFRVVRARRVGMRDSEEIAEFRQERLEIGALGGTGFLPALDEGGGEVRFVIDRMPHAIGFPVRYAVRCSVATLGDRRVVRTPGKSDGVSLRRDPHPDLPHFRVVRG